VTAAPQDCPKASAAAPLGFAVQRLCNGGATGSVMDHEMVYDIEMVDG